MRLETVILKEGKWTLLCVVQDGKNKVWEYLDRLETSRPDEYAAVQAALDRFADDSSTPKLKPEGEGVFALPAGRQQRLYGFYGGRQRFVFVEGSTKKKDGADQALLKRVRRVREEFNL
jgi:hypothetical protein